MIITKKLESNGNATVHMKSDVKGYGNYIAHIRLKNILELIEVEKMIERGLPSDLPKTLYEKYLFDCLDIPLENLKETLSEIQQSQEHQKQSKEDKKLVSVDNIPEINLDDYMESSQDFIKEADRKTQNKVVAATLK